MGQGLLIIEASRSHSDTPQSVGILWTSDQPDEETTWNNHKRHISTSPAEIEPTNPANEWPQSHASDRPVPIIPCIRIFKVLSKDTADVIVKSPDIQQKPKFIFLMFINKNTKAKIIYYTSGNVTNIPSTTSLTVCLFVCFWRNSRQWARASSFTRFLYHTQRRNTVGRTPLDEWSARRRDLYLTKHNTHNRQTSMPPVGFEPMISAGERPQTHALDRATTSLTVSTPNQKRKIVWIS